MSQVEQFLANISEFITKDKNGTFARQSTTIRHHTDKLALFGDFGFPITRQAWHCRGRAAKTDARDNMTNIFDGNEAEFKSALVAASSGWPFPIERVHIQKFRCLVFLNRAKCFRNVLKAVLYDDRHYGRWQQQSSASIAYDIQLHQRTDDRTLTEYRCALVSKALANLVAVSGLELVQSGRQCADKSVVEISVTSSRLDVGDQRRPCEIDYNNNTRRIICGTVKYSEGHTFDDYIRLQSAEMIKMAELKYGPAKDAVPYDMDKLGAAIVTFEFLNVKYNNVIDCEKNASHASAQKNAAFVLYNVARLQCLLTTFDKHVAAGYYGALPPFDEVDFRLLVEEEEWQIFHVYVIGLPSLLERCISGIDCGRVSVHLLCSSLSNLVALFSVYYHRVKILTENLSHLMPSLYARIYFLKAVRVILLKMLAILEIEPLDQM